MSEKILLKRANTDSERDEVMQRLLIAWKSSKFQRLSQFLMNAIATSKNPTLDPFYVEDFELVEMAEEFAKRMT